MTLLAIREIFPSTLINDIYTAFHVSRPTRSKLSGLCGTTMKGNSRENELVKSCEVEEREFTRAHKLRRASRALRTSERNSWRF